jgi:hypothetical protein
MSEPRAPRSDSSPSSRDQLRSAVAKAGPMVKNVRDHLQLRD